MPGIFIHNATVELLQDPPIHVEDERGTSERLLIMLVIFAVSLTAVSFPTLTATFRSIRVPSIIFFIGKHFGTGVILSTAFVHLLQDAFKALQKPVVNERWKIGDFAGLIVLISLLCIFVVEYISTAFVERLQSYPSAPSTPTESIVPSRAESVEMEFDPPPQSHPAIVIQSPRGSPTAWLEGHPQTHESDVQHVAGFYEAGCPAGAPPLLASSELADGETRQLQSAHSPSPSHSPTLTSSPHSERTPLRADAHSRAPSRPDAAEPEGRSYGATYPRSSHHRPPLRPLDKHTHDSAPSADSFFCGGHHRHEPRDSHASHHARVSRWRWLGLSFPWYTRSEDIVGGTADAGVGADAELGHSRSHAHNIDHSRIQSHCQEVSPPPSNGTTKAREQPQSLHAHGRSQSQKSGASARPHSHHGHGHGHAHMDMERWMNGIDGDVEGDGHRHRHVHVDEGEGMADGDEDEQVTKVGRRRQVIGILVLQLGIMIHSLVIGLTLSITSGPEFTSLVIAIVFHQLFEGLSLGIRIAGLPSSHHEHGFHHFPGHTLKPLLAFTFATTTPFGIALGLLTLSGHSRGPNLILAQGVMSAISAGMLIYAACVEMLAGDFVMDAHLWRSSVRRQVLALVSLFGGVIAMAAIGFLD